MLELSHLGVNYDNCLKPENSGHVAVEDMPGRETSCGPPGQSLPLLPPGQAPHPGRPVVRGRAQDHLLQAQLDTEAERLLTVI